MKEGAEHVQKQQVKLEKSCTEADMEAQLEDGVIYCQEILFPELTLILRLLQALKAKRAELAKKVGTQTSSTTPARHTKKMRVPHTGFTPLDDGENGQDTQHHSPPAPMAAPDKKGHQEMETPVQDGARDTETPQKEGTPALHAKKVRTVALRVAVSFHHCASAVAGPLPFPRKPGPATARVCRSIKW